jgi:hypothetical protein
MHERYLELLAAGLFHGSRCVATPVRELIRRSRRLIHCCAPAVSKMQVRRYLDRHSRERAVDVLRLVSGVVRAPTPFVVFAQLALSRR